MRSDIKKERVGEVRRNNSGESMEIIEYISSRDIIVKFKDGNIKRSTYKAFKKGEIRNPSSTLGTKGDVKMMVNKNEVKPSYKKWKDMLARCYGKNVRESYKNAEVCEEWLEYKNFEIWYDNNYWNCEGEVLTLDKDILFKGNKIYSPETCLFVPHSINSSFNSCKTRRGNLPIGVSKYRDGRYTTSINKHSKQEWIGRYDTPEEAFDMYKKAKEEYIKQVADEYKTKYLEFPKQLYNAMYNYKVEMTD